MTWNIFYLFLLFFIYAVIGYIIEVTMVSINTKKLTLSRGFLIGPYIPIYGMGAICMVRLLSKYENDLLVLFIMSTLICTILEYLTSLVMEKVFKLRWWDYSHMNFNINGRVCLTNSILFGLGGIIIIRFINPIIEKILLKQPYWLTILLSVSFFIIFMIDFIISVIAMFNLKLEVKKYTKKDATETIKKEIADFLKNHRFLRESIDRLFSAFPNVDDRKDINFIDYKELVLRIKEEIKEAKAEYRKRKKEFKNKCQFHKKNK